MIMMIMWQLTVSWIIFSEKICTSNLSCSGRGGGDLYTVFVEVHYYNDNTNIIIIIIIVAVRAHIIYCRN